ncbi:DUF4265 domain-containing protein [Streptomyces sp. FH025]|uniref:DUF4265 domain-containing protein n=1 Tax=Streptomyces sp. FH025 TaxID=2815937 RepID=UPI001A9D0927|nr:DUF4265 domain-containing protein [Streptomyces sp. FH025]MBO1417096.1 DUF4265 domain-containing protein [Streptomyces sp. FH025]
MTFTHIRLLAGYVDEERPVHEVLPARVVEDGLVVLAGSPGLVLGCAAGDRLRVAADGGFEVVEPGGNLCLQAARPDGRGLAPAEVGELSTGMAELGGLVEAPADGRFVVVTVARSAGWPAVERVMDAWVDGIGGVEWWVGNGDDA